MSKGLVFSRPFYFFNMNIDFLYSKFLELKKISTDTRKEIKDSIFFCLKGSNFNGNNYALDAIKKGAEIVIVDEKIHKKDPKLFYVNNVLNCLQDLAKKHRNTLKIPVFAITGTNGKTSTKNLIFDVLKQKYNTKKTSGNFNNHIGLPLTILSIDKNHEIAVLEFGASKLGDIQELCEIGKPTHGLITNIGNAHLQEFINVENIINTKTELWKYLIKNKGTIFLNTDDKNLVNKRKINKVYSSYNNICEYGSTTDKIQIIESNPYLNFKWENKLVKTKIVGEYNLINIIASINIGKFFGVDLNKIKKVLTNYKFKNNRSELIKTKYNQIILDAYNANPSSMMIAIKSFIKLKTNFDKVIILGDMLELGVEAIKFHKEIIEYLHLKKIKNCILVGDIFLKISCDFLKFKTKEQLVKNLSKEKIKQKLILIKGSRKMKLETLIDTL